MKFTLQLTANAPKGGFGVVKQVVFECEDALAAYERQREILTDYLLNGKDVLGMMDMFIGYTLKVWEGEQGFEFTKESIDVGDSKAKIAVVGWRGKDGSWHDGKPMELQEE
jgi:hypothetical protein